MGTRASRHSFSFLLLMFLLGRSQEKKKMFRSEHLPVTNQLIHSIDEIFFLFRHVYEFPLYTAHLCHTHTHTESLTFDNRNNCCNSEMKMVQQAWDSGKTRRKKQAEKMVQQENRRKIKGQEPR